MPRSTGAAVAIDFIRRKPTPHSAVVCGNRYRLLTRNRFHLSWPAVRNGRPGAASTWWMGNQCPVHPRAHAGQNGDGRASVRSELRIAGHSAQVRNSNRSRARG